MNKGDFEKIIADCKQSGYEIRVRDIVYCILKNQIEEIDIVYNSLFQDQENVDAKVIGIYDKSKPMKFLSKYINANYGDMAKDIQEDGENKGKKNVSFDDISFEENKAELIKMLNDIDSMVANGDLENKDALKMKIDIRTKLNDKFGSSEKTSEQKIVVVPKKFDLICPRTRTECYQMTKEYAMEHFGLIEKPNNTKQ